MRRRALPLWHLRSRWRELLADRERPQRTALAFALGAWIGATPVLGVHTWLALSAGTLLRLPPLAVVLGTNLSNPLTFIPITLLELRLGSWLLGRSFKLLPGSFQVADISDYLLEAWLGWALFGSALAVLCYVILRLALRSRVHST